MCENWSTEVGSNKGVLLFTTPECPKLRRKTVQHWTSHIGLNTANTNKVSSSCCNPIGDPVFILLCAL